MGCNSSKAINKQQTYIDAVEDLKPKTKAQEWKCFLTLEEATVKYQQDGSLPANFNQDHLELRAILDDPLSQRWFGIYLKESSSLNLFSCWVAIQEFKNIPAADFRRSSSRALYNKYIQPGAVVEINVLTNEQRNDIKNIVYSNAGDDTLLNSSSFNEIQVKCFEGIYANVFNSFKSSEAYRELKKTIKDRYNRVSANDFEYFEKLGEGGFGVVVHCKKKSTQKHYAMKILYKCSLLEYYYDDPIMVSFEKQAFSSLQYPFIVNMHYAFQTPSLVMLVMDLSLGDLNKALKKCPGYRMDPERVRFYSAEVLLALAYMHQAGIIYRDLKPGNILLNSDGHIQLIDLGCALFQDKSLTLSAEEQLYALPLFDNNIKVKKHNMQPLVLSLERTESTFSTTVSASTESNTNSNSISISNTNLAIDPNTNTNTITNSLWDSNNGVMGQICGTIGYIAPEIAIQSTRMDQNQPIRYNPSVDFWSLGVTMYKLLVGKLPFSASQLESLLTMYNENSSMGNPDQSNIQALIDSFQETVNSITFPEKTPPVTVDIITKLLDISAKKRLGGGTRGAQEIKMHPYFKGIDWEMMELKQVNPPYLPSSNEKREYSDHHFDSAPEPVYDDQPLTFEECMGLIYKSNEGWNKDVPDEESQKYFNNWDFISHKTLKMEFGVAHELEAFDKSFKVRQMMGDVNDINVKKNTSWFE